MKIVSCRIRGFLLVLWVMVMFLPTSAAAVEVSIPPTQAVVGSIVIVPLKIDAVDNLAGVKMVISYDPAVLIFQKATKTSETSSLMHVVNDKQPGRLIVVMAGAVGIKGKNFTILDLSFRVSPKDNAPQSTTRLEINEVQLMSDKLKEIPSTLRVAEMKITAPGTQSPPPESPSSPPTDQALPDAQTNDTGPNQQ